MRRRRWHRICWRKRQDSDTTAEHALAERDLRVTGSKLPHSCEELSKTTISESETDDDVGFSDSTDTALDEASLSGFRINFRRKLSNSRCTMIGQM